MATIDTPIGPLDPEEATAGVQVYVAAVDAGARLAQDFGALLTTFMEQRVTPLVRFTAEAGGDGRAVLSAFAEMVRDAANAIDSAISP